MAKSYQIQVKLWEDYNKQSEEVLSRATITLEAVPDDITSKDVVEALVISGLAGLIQMGCLSQIGDDDIDKGWVDETFNEFVVTE